MAETIRNSPGHLPCPEKSFDPYALGPDHSRHAKSTSILRIGESGRILCPFCLETAPLNGIEHISDVNFERYIWNLLDLIELHQTRTQLRRILLTFIQKIVTKRPLRIRSIRNFHNILHILYKSIDNQISIHEFSSISIIISRISRQPTGKQPVSIVSLWKVTKSLLEHAEDRFLNVNDSSVNGLNAEMSQLLEASSMIVNMHLETLRHSTLEQIPEQVFYIDEDDPSASLKCYRDSQIACLKFTSRRLMSSIWPFLTTITRELRFNELSVVTKVFIALQESLLAAIRLNDSNLIGVLIERDVIGVVSSIISHNKGREIRTQLRNFLKHFVIYLISQEYNVDSDLDGMFDPVDVVETNFRNAIAFSSNESKLAKTAFYLVLNYVAKKINSKYYQSHKVKRVMKCIDIEKMNLISSKLIWRVFCHLAASLVVRVGLFDNIESFMSKHWRKMKASNNVDNNVSKFEEDYCFSEAFFFWAHEHPDFVNAATTRTIEHMAKICIHNRTINNLLKKLLERRHYKVLVRLYLSYHDSATQTIKAIVKTDCDPEPEICHEPLMAEMSAIIPALLHNSLLNTLNRLDELSDLEMVKRLLTIVLTLAKNCQHFNLDLDEQFIIDLFRLAEKLYINQSIEGAEEILMVINDLITVLIVANDPNLMIIFKHLDHSIRGYMYHHLSDYTKGDVLSENIAHLLVVYDELDYPIANDLTTSLKPLALSATNWMFSSCEDLHKLSMIVVKQVLGSCTDSHSRICVSIGLLNMLATNPKLIETRINWRIIEFAIQNDEVRYNPITGYLLKKLPFWVKNQFEDLWREMGQRPVSPSLSFGTSDDQSSIFDEIQTAVANALDRLPQDDHNESDNPRTIPNFLFASKFLKDKHSRAVDSGQWEDLALRMNGGEPY